MKTEIRNSLLLTLLLLMSMILPLPASADPGSQYCVTPSFITAGMKPNLLMLIDNSASMFDLAYVDKGKKHCSTTGVNCFYDTDCSSGETCSVFDRSPYYCYDESYKSTNSYYGYFDKDTFYSYRSGTDDFAPVASAFPSGCGSVSAGSTTRTIANNMCVEFLRPNTLYSFVAKGNYLNWLTASKFDIEKKILTGGKFDGSSLFPQSRGCVGQGYVKDADTTDFVNYSGGDINNTNTSLGVTFSITGPSNLFNSTAPSTGGSTFINLYSGTVPYDAGKCQAAITAIATASGTGPVASAVADCLASTTPPTGTCSIYDVNPTTGGPVSQPCLDTGPPATPNCQPAAVPKHCAKNSAITTCTPGAISPLDGCFAAGSVCTVGKVGSSCTDATDCDIKACSGDLSRTCSVTAPDCQKAEVLGTCKNGSAACSSDAGCSGKNNVCQNYVAGYDYGSCGVKTVGVCTAGGGDQGPCLYATGGNLGTCQFSPHDTLVKTNVFFGSSMQTCWALRKNGTDPGVDDYNAIVKNCPIIYAGYKSCKLAPMTVCTADLDCGASGPCLTGPAAIGPGNSALLCALNYEGQMFTNSPAGSTTWVEAPALPASVPAACSAGDTVKACILKINKTFCNNLSVPGVTDPTDAPSDTQITDNLPAILSGIGVDAQLGGVIKTMRAKVAVSTPACTTSLDCAALNGTSCVSGTCKPTGLVQQFSSMIRLGAMTFNQYGSAAETALTGTPKTCPSGNPCSQDVDCASPPVAGSCAPTTNGTTNLDGGRIIYPIGNGFCATMTSNACTSDAGCSGFNTCLNGYCGNKGSTICTTAANCSGSNQACISTSAGDHTTANSLIKALDDVNANAWTPFSEAFYNAIGYFARIPSGTDEGKSRTALRLNSLNTTSTDYSSFITSPLDFNESYNPSEYRCQQNYVMLISDGASTADRNANVKALATLYATPAGITQTTCPTSPTATNTDYGGNNNLPIMTWLAKNRNIATFSTASPVSTAAAANARDSIGSYVVFNGESNGAAGDCNSLTLLTKAANKGGTTIKQASDYPSLVAALTSVFQDVAAKAASGTAASILSNSEGSGANILQAVFYPKKIFQSLTSANWIGEMQNLWYFVDPYVNNSTIREDTDIDTKLNLVSDYVVRFAFDPSSDRTMVQRYVDSDGNGTADATVGALIDPDDVKALWRAGDSLWRRDISASPRTLYTPLLSGGSGVSGTGLMYFTYGDIGTTSFPDNSTALQPYLQYPTSDAANNGRAVNLMKWVHGFDFPPSYPLRNRTVKRGSIPDATFESADYYANSGNKGIGVWKLGDIISSTPRVQSTVRLNTYNLPYPGGYSDKSYETFIGSKEYQKRGMVYVGGNDGMMHAFYLGVLSVKSAGFEKASLSDPDTVGLGKEVWSYIPKNTLPYLQYLADPAYNHIYSIDGRTSIFDASIGYTGDGTCVRATYDTCDKLKNSSVVTDSNYLDAAKNTWRTVVIGGMGIGGASSLTCTAGTNCVPTPIADPADSAKGLGYSSYFALDVTIPESPKLLWEYNNPAMGYSTSGPAIIRIGDPNKNGKWYAVFGSGPTGPIKRIDEQSQFLGNSDQNLKFFVVDVQTGVEVGVVDTGITNAFSGPLLGASIDVDRGTPNVTGNYQDDAIYVGYTKKNTDVTPADWTQGGVGRIVTKESANVSDWVWSRITDNIGPVTTAISRLQDKKNRNFWLFFGTGRYFFRYSTTLDDNAGNRALFGIKEPCYNTTTMPGNFLDKTCTEAISGSVADQTSSITSTIPAGTPGWKITLDASTSSEGAERVVTDTVALVNGTVFFTSFKPTLDLCGYGGNSYLWGVKYDTGDKAAASALTGKALIQLSTGEFKEVDLATAFTDKLNRRMSTPMTGKPPSDAPPIVSSSSNKPVKKILHIQER